MNIGDLEDELAAIVRVEIPNALIEIVHLPENTLDFKRPPVGGARITVGYNESNFKDNLNTRAVAQPEEMVLVISIQSRTLRGDFGIYTLKQSLEDALLGYTPSNCDMPICGVYFGPPGPGMDVLNEDVWSFVYHIKTRSVAVQKRDIVDAILTPNYDETKLTFNISAHG